MPDSAVFVFIRQEPQSQFLDGMVERTQEGFILTGMDLLQGNKPPESWPLDRDLMHLETSVPGVFTAGEVRRGVRQGVAAAIGEGNTAVSLFWQYLSTI
jgi:thioredoxin reductase (NADPH)